MRVVYAIIFCGNLQGSSYYRTYDEAVAAANLRSYCTGVKWTVKEILIPERED